MQGIKMSIKRTKLFSFHYLKLLVTLVIWNCLVQNQSLATCPTSCDCKWKDGKQTVNCRRKEWDTIPEGIDEKTQVLDMSENELITLPPRIFEKARLLNLQKVYLSKARLSQIDPKAFTQLINLVTIDLSDNELRTVPYQAFKSTKLLRELSLKGNPISIIENGAFQFVPGLVKLDLSFCQITKIEDFAFTKLQRLEQLKIHHNQLSELSNATVKALSKLHEISLEKNHWECDCHLRDLKLWLQNENIPYTVSPVCKGPEKLKGSSFARLSVDQFACAPVILDSERNIRIPEGSDAVMECRVESIPRAKINWFSGGRPIHNNTSLSVDRKFLIFESESSSRLMLTNALKKDEGNFFCEVKNSADSKEANFTLEIVEQQPFTEFDATYILIIILAIVTILVILLGIAILLYWRHRSRSRKPSEILSMSTPVKPPRLDYEINPGSLVANGYKSNVKGDPSHSSATDNPDLIIESSNNPYQDTGLEERSSNSDLNWDQQSYRNMGYAMEYPPDYGLPIIHENSVYNESAYYNGVNGASVMSGVWNKNKVGARITAPNARDSPDEGYQEGYCGTDV